MGWQNQWPPEDLFIQIVSGQIVWGCWVPWNAFTSKSPRSKARETEIADECVPKRGLCSRHWRHYDFKINMEFDCAVVGPP